MEAVSPEMFLQHQPHRHLLARDAGAMRARCSVWVGSVPWAGGVAGVVGVVGHFAAVDAAAGAAVLEAAVAVLRAQGCCVAIGPMDGNTWRRYRLVTDAGMTPAFFLEPTNPAHHVEAFVRARLAEMGVVIRPLETGRFAEEAWRIYELSLVSFRHNYLYTPLPEAEFLGSYEKVKAYVRPELCRLAEHADCVPLGTENMA